MLTDGHQYRVFATFVVTDPFTPVPAHSVSVDQFRQRVGEQPGPFDLYRRWQFRAAESPR